MSEVITRFAPSPTGHLHIGGVRTALFCWAYAQRFKPSGGGRFIIRIEDTDQARSSEEATRGILEDLAWLGLDWDEGPELDVNGRIIGGDPRGVGPFYQSQRLGLYQDHLERLIEQDLAYPAFETPEELDAKRKAVVDAKGTYRYDGAGFDVPRDERMARLRDGEPHVIRMRVPGEAVTVADRALGDVTFDAPEIDDFVLRKRDGFPTYHFAVVVDDALMGVTHVLRGQEHLINTPKHMLLQHALGVPTPTYAHMPLIFNADGSKMSKRDKDKAARAACKAAGLTDPPIKSIDNDRFSAWLKDKKSQLETGQLVDLATALSVGLPEIDADDFRRSGYLTDVLCNYLARLGWSAGDDQERFDRAWFIDRFELDRIGKKNATFDRDKLLAFNNDTLTTVDQAAWCDAFETWAARHAPAIYAVLDGRIPLYAEAMQARSKTMREAAERGAFLLQNDATLEYDEKAVKKFLLKGEPTGVELLRDFRAGLTETPFEVEALDAAVASFCEDREIGMGKIAQPIRVALTGATVTPPIGVTLALLGRERTLALIDRCLEVHGT